MGGNFQEQVRSGDVQPLSPPRHDTIAPEEPTPVRVQPPRRAKMKDVDFRYTARGPCLATVRHTPGSRTRGPICFILLL